MDYSEGIKALILGLSTVFLVLILISIIISLLKHINFHKDTKPANIAGAPKAEPVVEKIEDDLELIAVITAAIAASLNTTTDRLQVTSFRRVGGSRGWNVR